MKLRRLSFIVLVLGTNKSPRSAERRELRAAISDTGYTTVYSMGVNGLEAANGWIFSQGFNGVSHTEYKVTIS